MKYPGLVAAGLVGAGILVAHLWPSVPVFLVGVCGTVSCGAWLRANSMRSRSLLNFAPLLFSLSGVLALVSFSALHYAAYVAPGTPGLKRWSRPDVFLPVTIKGMIRSTTLSAVGRVSFEIDVRSVTVEKNPLRANGRVLIQTWNNSGSLAALDNQVVHPGDIVRLSGTLSAVQPPRNPFDFDAAAFYTRNGISSLFTPDASKRIGVVHRHQGAVHILARIRTYILSRIDANHIAVSSKELLPALLLGVRSWISPESNEAFRTSGLAHLLAISGLHVGVVGLVLYWMIGLLVGRLGLSFRYGLALRCAFTFSLLLLYAVLSGGSPSVTRAVAMAGVVLTGKAVFRQVQGWNALGLAALFMLMLWPEQLFSVGFQLSFAAVAGIFLFSGVVDRLREFAWRHPPPFRRLRALVIFRWIAASVTVSVAVTCSTLPVVLFHFGSVPLGGMVVNVLAIPLTTMVLVSAILSTIAGTLPVVGIWLVSSTDFLTTTLVGLASIASQLLGGLAVHAGRGTISLIGCLPVMMVALLRRRHRVAFAHMTLLVAAVFTLDHSPGRLLRLDFLDVGQGDAIFIVTPSGRSVVVDTGPGAFSGATILRHATGLGLKRIDLLVVSHFHMDHTGGIPYLLSKIPVSRVVVARNQVKAWQDFFGKETVSQPVVRPINRGDTLRVDDSVRLLVLGPAAGGTRSPAASQETISRNDLSLVVKLIYGTTSFLMTGDAESGVERDLVRNYGSMLSSDVVKVAHHGSRTSSSMAFLSRAATPGGWAAVSVGSRNRFGHPNDSVIERWKRSDVRVESTAREGGLTFESDGMRVNRAAWRTQ